MELKTYFAQDRSGNLIPSANVSIFLTGTTTLASGLTNVSGAALANPFTADADGKIQFRAPDGIYDMQVSLGSTTGVKVTFQCVDVEQQLSDANSAADRAEAAAESIESQAASITANTREQWRRALAEVGLTLVSGSFEAGATASAVTDAVWHIEGGQCYTWGGTLPKTVPAGSSPGSTGGVGSGAWISVASITLRSQLSSTNGGIIQAFDTVAAMKAYPVVAGRSYQTKGYWAVGDGGGATYYTTAATGAAPNGYSDHVSGNGVYIRLFSEPTDLNHGVKVSPLYVPADARHNRNALQAMLRDERWSETTCVAKGTYYFLGSANIGRSNIRWTINKGCFIRGRYSDPSIPTPDQAGGMFNFVDYFDPDNGDFAPFTPGDTRVNKYLSNIHVVLNGDISSEYNAIHTNPYNNNCISMAKVINCSVTGSGGVSESDHRAINFDAFSNNVVGGSENRGGNINCHVDIAYINGTVDNPVMMIADIFTPSLCTVKVGSVGVMRTGGYNQPIVVNVGNAADFRIDIGKYDGDSTISPRIVVARECNSVHVKTGIIRNATTVVYSIDTADVTLEPEEVYNTVTLINRVDTVSGKLRSLRLRNLKSCNTALLAAIYTTSNISAFQIMEISNCSFSGALAIGFKLHGNRLAPNIATIEDVHDNYLPSGGETSGIFNRWSNGVSANQISADVENFSFNPKSPAFLYSKASICVRNGAARGIVEMDLNGRLSTVNNVIYTAGGQTLTTTVSGGVITLTATSPAVINFVFLHN